MDRLRFTLLSDGSSDRALIPLLELLLAEHLTEAALEAEWADLGRLPNPPKGLPDRMEMSLRLYPCDLLFVHRDAEGKPVEDRRREIEQAKALMDSNPVPDVVPVVPVRMMEAWLLVDEGAIRGAAGNPNGRESLELPATSRLEDLPDPKAVLFDCLKEASGLSGVRRKRFRPHAAVHRVAQLQKGIEPLRELQAFRRLETDLSLVLSRG